MSDPTLPALTADIAALRTQLQSATTSVQYLVQAVELLDRSIHQFEATHPAAMSNHVRLLLQQIRRSHPGPLPAPLPAPAPPLPSRRRNQRHSHLRYSPAPQA